MWRKVAKEVDTCFFERIAHERILDQANLFSPHGALQLQVFFSFFRFPFAFLFFPFLFCPFSFI